MPRSRATTPAARSHPAVQPVDSARALCADELEVLRRAVGELSYLRDLARITASTHDRDELRGLIIRETCRVMDAEVCSLYVVRGGDLVLAATNGLNPAGVGTARMPLGTGITGAAAARGDLVAVEDAVADPRFHWIDGLDEARFTSMCSAPLMSRDAGAVGVLNVQSVARRRWNDDERATLMAIASQLAGIIERTELRDRIEAQLAEARSLVRVSHALLAAAENAEAEHVLVREAAAALGDMRVWYWRVDGVTLVPLPGAGAGAGEEVAVDGIEDLVRAAIETRASRQMIVSITPAAARTGGRRPGRGRVAPAPHATVFAVPLMGRSAALGALVAMAPPGDTMGAHRLGLLETMANLGALAVDDGRARVAEREATARWQHVTEWRSLLLAELVEELRPELDAVRSLAVGSGSSAGIAADLGRIIARVDALAARLAAEPAREIAPRSTGRRT